MKHIFIAEVAIQKQNMNEKHLLWYYSNLRSLCWLWWKTIS